MWPLECGTAGAWGHFAVCARRARQDYGGTIFAAKGMHTLGSFEGYRPLVLQIGKFFRTGEPPVSAQETLEMFAFMSAADESKKLGGAAVSVGDLLREARVAAVARLKSLGVDVPPQ